MADPFYNPPVSEKTLLEEYAGQAMMGMLADEGDSSCKTDVLVERAFEIAEAMVRYRSHMRDQS